MKTKPKLEIAAGGSRSAIAGRTRSSIRRSTRADIRPIHAWLVREEARGVEGNFLCNWRITKERLKERRALVYVNGADRVPVAYQWGGLVYPGILQVRHDMRHKGIGKKLVVRCVAQAYKRDECLLLIECTPSSSIPFWQAMGFTLLDDTKRTAYRILEKKHELPADGNIVRADVRFYPEDRLWNESISPYDAAASVAARTPDGVIHLSERVFCFKDLHPEGRDPVLEVVIDGQPRFLDKAKRPEAERIGIRGCPHGFYIDRIHP